MRSERYVSSSSEILYLFMKKQKNYSSNNWFISNCIEMTAKNVKGNPTKNRRRFNYSTIEQC